MWWTALLGVLKPFLKVLAFGVTIPVGLILAAGLWLYFDRGSAIRQAVDKAVIELVDGAELEAARAKADALELINAELKGRAEALEGANQRFSASLEQAQNDLETANDQILDLSTSPVNAECVVDSDVLSRLRSN